MQNKKTLLSVCLDSNVIVSAIAFGGKPLKVLDRALCRDFHLVMGPPIFKEVRRNLVGKLELSKKLVDKVLNDIRNISSIYVPKGSINVTPNDGDNLVLEIAKVGGCDILVTGDKKHLLPLSPYEGLIIEPPSKFLSRLESTK